MRVTVAAIGRLKDGAERVLVDRFMERLELGRQLGIHPAREVELPESRQKSTDRRKSDEAQRLLDASADADVLIALDPAGKTLTSEGFAIWLGARRDAGARHMVFCIGGPDGHGADLLATVHLRLSLGPMTLPHGLARVVLVEQIYRAMTILAGHPYHRS